MKENKVGKNLLEIFFSIGVPAISGLLFIVWVFYFFKNPVLVFPLTAILVLALHYFSGHIQSGLLAVFASAAALLGIMFVGSAVSMLLLMLEIVWLAAFYFALETYRVGYVSMRNKMKEEFDILDRDITLKDSEIIENNKRSSAIIQKIDNFQTMGRMIQSFEASLNEQEIIEKSGDLAAKFIGKGNWKLKKSVYGDIFAKYVKSTGMPLMVTDLSSDRRFPTMNNRYFSIIAVPVEVNGVFWGILRGTAPKKNAFTDADLRLLSILSGIVSTVLNNTYLYLKIQDLAITDGLTGLYTQSYFKERLKEEMKRSRSNRVPLSVAILDVDFFKKINDTYGHLAGDVILRQVAALLRGRFRETDLLSRYGGEEFGVIMLHTDETEAEKVLEEIRSSIEKERFFLPIESYHPVQVRITVSIGFAELSRGTASVEDEIIKKADRALYEAKKAGRNCVIRFKNEQ